MEVAELLPFISRASTPILCPVCDEVLPAEKGDMDEPLVLLESPAEGWVCDCVEVPDESCAGDGCACTAAVIRHSAAAALEFISLLFIYFSWWYRLFGTIIISIAILNVSAPTHKGDTCLDADPGAA